MINDLRGWYNRQNTTCIITYACPQCGSQHSSKERPAYLPRVLWRLLRYRLFQRRYIVLPCSRERMYVSHMRMGR